MIENVEVMVILFIMVILGYVLYKLGYMGDKFEQKLSAIVIDVTCPALILSSVMGSEIPDRSLILPLLVTGFLTYILLLVYGFLVPRFITQDRDARGMIGFALMFANVGFIGYPIVASIFGVKAVLRSLIEHAQHLFYLYRRCNACKRRIQYQEYQSQVAFFTCNDSSICSRLNGCIRYSYPCYDSSSHDDGR